MDLVTLGFVALGGGLRSVLGFLTSSGLDFKAFQFRSLILAVIFGTLAGGALAFGAGLDSITAQLLAGFAGSEMLKKSLSIVGLES